MFIEEDGIMSELEYRYPERESTLKENRKLIARLMSFMEGIDVVNELIEIREKYESKYKKSPHDSVEGELYINKELQTLLDRYLEHKDNGQKV